MEQTTRTVLYFDRFVLDLTRGCLRKDGHDIALPPKPFGVLRHLAENAGRLVSKDEMHDALWPNVTVADDSLVQCISELRQKLGDDSHRLIKTVPRRGYLLDAVVLASPPHREAAGSQAQPLQGPQALPDPSPAPRWSPRAIALRRPQAMPTAVLLCLTVAAISLLTVVFDLGPKRTPLADIALLPLSPSPATDLFSARDAERVASLAADKQLSLPPFVIRKPAKDIPDGHRRFVGVWVSDAGWPRSNRQLMLIVTAIDAAGIVEGYLVDGPPQPTSRDQGPARSAPFLARAAGDAFYFGSATGERVASLTPDRQVEFKRTWRDGGASSLTLTPVWTLIEAEQEVRKRWADKTRPDVATRLKP